jgi:hypothetical protein
MNEGEPNWQIKDALLIIPLAASALAISWEIGRFAPFGGFRLFTISDHLLAALSALPIALIFTIYFLAVLGLIPTIGALAARHRVRFFLGCTIASVSVCACVYYFFGGRLPTASSAVITGIVLLAVANSLWFGIRLTSPVGLLFLLGTSIILAMVMGSELSQSLADSAKQGDKRVTLTDITLKTGTTRGYILMAGERGMLFYVPERDRLIFVRLEDIQRIEWQR